MHHKCHSCPVSLPVETSGRLRGFSWCGVTQDDDKTNRKWRRKSENEPRTALRLRSEGVREKEKKRKKVWHWSWGIRGKNGESGEGRERERCEKASTDNGATPSCYNSYEDGDVVARVNNEKESKMPVAPIKSMRCVRHSYPKKKKKLQSSKRAS